jgi:hypothetical protein
MSAVLSVALTCSSGVVSSTPASTWNVTRRHQSSSAADQRRSAAISGQLAAIEGHQRSSAVIRGHQEGHQRSSDVIRGHQRPSSVIIGQLAVTNGPSTATAPVR